MRPALNVGDEDGGRTTLAPEARQKQEGSDATHESFSHGNTAFQKQEMTFNCLEQEVRGEGREVWH